MNEPTACPFCGKADRVKIVPYRADDNGGEPFDWGFTVQCSAAGFDHNPNRGCGSSGAWGETEAEAIAAWNRRAILPPPAGHWSDPKTFEEAPPAGDGMQPVAWRKREPAYKWTRWSYSDGPDKPQAGDTFEYQALFAASPLNAVPDGVREPTKRVGQLIDEALRLAPEAGLFLEITVKESKL